MSSDNQDYYDISGANADYLGMPTDKSLDAVVAAAKADERAKVLDELADEDVRRYVADAVEAYWEDDINEDGGLTEEEFEYRRLRVRKFIKLMRQGAGQ